MHVYGSDDRITRERIHRDGGYVVVGEEGETESVIGTSNGNITFRVETKN